MPILFSFNTETTCNEGPVGHASSTDNPSPPKLLDQLKAALPTRHYSRKTEQAYVFWVRRFVLFHNKKHPKDMGEAEISRFLTHLAVKENVAASTQNQCLCTLIFLYSHAIQKEVGDLSIYWAQKPKKLPTVLSQQQVK